MEPGQKSEPSERRDDAGEAMNKHSRCLGGYLQNWADPRQLSFCFLFLGYKN